MEYVKFISAALINVILVVGIYLLEKRTRFKNLKKIHKQIIIGILFGGSSIYASIFGVKIWGATMNVRDASPISAGLIFGPVAGIIAGVMGGGFRALTVLWNPDSAFTVIACSTSTLLAGIISALLRRYMFDNKKAGWASAIGVTVVLESFHMLMIFITNMNNAYDAFLFVRQCTIPMIVANAISVGLSLFIVTLLSKEKIVKKGKDKRISTTFQRWLLLCIVCAYAITSVFTYNLQTGIAERQVESSFATTMNDVITDVKLKAETNMLSIANQIKEGLDSANLSDLLQGELDTGEKYEICEINIIDTDGVIKKSSDATIVGFDFYDKDNQEKQQIKEFIALLEDETKVSLVQDFTVNAKGKQRKYAGIKLANGQILQIAYDKVQYRTKLDGFIVDVTKNRHVGATGFIAVCDEELKIVSQTGVNGKHISVLGIIPSENMKKGIVEEKIFETEIVNPYNRESQGIYKYVYTFKEEYFIISAMPDAEVTVMRDASLMLSTFMQVLIFAVLFLILYLLIKKIIINNLHEVNSKLSQISSGNLSVTVDVRANEEFDSLSNDINTTVTTLKHYIAEAEARIDKELEYAKQIQLSVLPTNFPKGEQYSIFAQMIAAKEVGGDFYDFYKLNDNAVAFLVADVSGKGIPAAMFMMTAKAIIKSLAESGLSVDECFTKANQKLCENNESGMFVTAWMGILDIDSGCLKFANAGHNPPLLKRADGAFEVLKTRPGLVLAGMEGVRYRMNEITLNQGDRLFLYTDGVVEATNADNVLYGEDRLLEFINTNNKLDATALLPKLKEDIDKFVDVAPQFDDITMLMFDYKVETKDDSFTSKTFPAKTEYLTDFIDFIERTLQSYDCPVKIQTAICIAIEEVFVNVAHYAYGEDGGDVKVDIAFDKPTRTVTFRMVDGGVAFNPLDKADPDITLSAEERQIGGLGILITKKTMDTITYAYENGENILTMTKKI